PRGALVPRFRGFDYYRHIVEPRPEERALARVSKDGHKQDRASGHPSRRRFAPPQDEVCGLISISARSDWFHGIDLLISSPCGIFATAHSAMMLFARITSPQRRAS